MSSSAIGKYFRRHAPILLFLLALTCFPFTPCPIKNLVSTYQPPCACALLPRCGDPFDSETCRGTAITSYEVVRTCLQTGKFSEQKPYLCICYAKHSYVCFLLNNSIHNNERASPELLRKNVWCGDLPCLHWDSLNSAGLFKCLDCWGEYLACDFL